MTYDELVGGGESAVQRLLGKQENLQLEFKGMDSREPIFVDGALQKNGRKILAKEASAFANSAGGVIVFGIDCRRDDFGVDQADKLTPISNIQRAETTVRDAAAELLQPKHDGIRVSSIPTAANENSGYVVVDVPRSDRRPHRSEAQGQKDYYKRIGGSSYPMEHYDIEDAFKRVSAPNLTLEVTLRRNMTMSEEVEYHVEIAFLNNGAVTAKSLTMQIWNKAGEIFGYDNYTRQLNTISTYGERTYIAAPADFVVHPGEVRKFHHFTARIERRQGVIHLGGRPLTKRSIGFDYAIGAENLRIEDRYMDLTAEIHKEVESFFGDII